MKTKKKNLFIILSSPSGAGKTTLAKKLLKSDRNIELSISYTTRKKRPKEKNKKDYNFVSEKEFNILKKKNCFLEFAKVFDNYYGTSKVEVKRIHNKGKDVLFDIDWQGSRKIKRKLGNDVVSIFILPPSKKELVKRLKKRAQDPDHVVKKRLSFYKKELSHWREYKYILINKNLNETLKKIKSIIETEKIINEKQTIILKKIRSL